MYTFVIFISRYAVPARTHTKSPFFYPKQALSEAIYGTNQMRCVRVQCGNMNRPSDFAVTRTQPG